ncbi:MAG: phosphatase PAP2 family protein [Planctomycetaceae bacterium]|nr:phosphatase PAP2 family protein [Planctomycetaceae bacterium]
MASSDKTSLASETLAEHRRWTRSALILAVVSALLAMGFFSLSRAVVRGSTGDLDERILLAMRMPDDLADPIGPRWVEEVGRDMTALGGVAVLSLITATVVSFFWLASMRRAAIYVAIAGAGAILLATALKQSFDRPRPDLVPHGSMVYTSSFPSGHSTMAAAVYLTLGMVASRFVPRRRLKILLIGVAMLVTGAVGVSRVYLGVHWPSDVLAGWAVGASWALVCWCVTIWLQDHGVIEQDLAHPIEVRRASL